MQRVFFLKYPFLTEMIRNSDTFKLHLETGNKIFLTVCSTFKLKALCVPSCSETCPGGGVLPIVAYTGRLRPKEVPFSGFRYIKG